MENKKTFFSEFMKEFLLIVGAILLISSLSDWSSQFTTPLSKFIVGIVLLVFAVLFGLGK